MLKFPSVCKSVSVSYKKDECDHGTFLKHYNFVIFPCVIYTKLYKLFIVCTISMCMYFREIENLY